MLHAVLSFECLCGLCKQGWEEALTVAPDQFPCLQWNKLLRQDAQWAPSQPKCVEAEVGMALIGGSAPEDQLVLYHSVLGQN